VHAVQPQLAGQHQAGRSAAGNDHVKHEPPIHFRPVLRAVRRRTPASTRTSRIPDRRRSWLRPEILRHDPGLAARPPMRWMLKVARSG
jgi:hypothetical protein